MSKKNSYSSFGFALAFSSFPIYIYTPIYYIEIYKLDIFLIGIVLLFLRILDAILDPLIGYYSSKLSVEKIKKYIFNVCILFFVSNTIKELTKILSIKKPDIVVILGDRYEIFSAAISCLILKIPIAHIHGGEVTQGAFDDSIRHSITKMSSIIIMFY